MGKAKLTLSGAAGAYGSEIKSYQITGGGWSAAASTLTTGILATAGEITFTAVVTASRGRTAQTTCTIEVIAYDKPGISSLSVYRCDSTGAKKNAGTYAAIEIKASYSAITGNTVTLKAAYKLTSDASYGSDTVLTNSSKTVIGGALSASHTYDVRITVADKFNTATVTASLRTKNVIWSVLPKGLGFAIGKVAELSGWLDIAWHTRIRGTVQADSYTTVALDNTSANPIIFVPRITADALGSGSDGSEYLKKWLAWVCKSYPNRYMPLFIGEIHPNAVGIVICHIYNTSVISADGLPQFATCKYFALNGGEVAFGTYDYSFYQK